MKSFWLSIQKFSVVKLTSGAISDVTVTIWVWLVVIPPFILFEWIQRRRPHPFQVEGMPAGFQWIAGVAVVWIMVILGRIESVPFIYFQF